MPRSVALGIALGISLGATALAAASSSDVPWSALRRPLHLPIVSSGARCPVSHVDRRVPWSRIRIFGGSGIGTGPVYPGLGAASGLVNATKDVQYGGRWQGQKVFWYVAPSYRGRVLIRGRRLDGPGRLGFNGGRVPGDELRIEPYDTVSWSGQPGGSRGIPTVVRALSSGCYGVQADGTTFSKVVVFQVDLAPVLGGKTPAVSGGVAPCAPHVRAGALPAWMNAGFGANARVTHVIGRRGAIGAVLWNKPLYSPPAKTVNNKILWVPRHPSKSVAPLWIKMQKMDGTRSIGAPVRRVIPDGPGPSYVDAPSAGCWRLTLSWSGRQDTLDLVYVPPHD